MMLSCVVRYVHVGVRSLCVMLNGVACCVCAGVQSQCV